MSIIKDGITMTSEEYFKKYPNIINKFYKTMIEIIAEREKVIITYNLCKENPDGSLTTIEKNITVGKTN